MVLYSNRFYSFACNGQEITELTINGKNMIGVKMPLFSIQLRNEKGEAVRISTVNAKTVNIDKLDGMYSLHYTDFENTDISVTASFEFSESSPLIKSRISVENCSNLCTEYIEFPQIAVPKDLKGNGGNAEILWPFNEGAIIDNMDIRENSWFAYEEPQYPSKGTAGLFPGIVCTQFLAYYDGESGLYLGAHDNKGNLKSVEVFGQNGGIKLQMRLYTGKYPGEDFKTDYDIVIGAFKGGWMEAADIYRTWFDENHSEEFVKIKDNTSLPDWYGESPVINAYPVRGSHDTDVMSPNKLFPYTNALPHIENISKKTKSRVMVLLMHWEGTAPWSPPYMWPPYGGEEIFREFSEKLHEKKHLLGVYGSGISWTNHSGVTYYDGEFIHKFKERGLDKFMCKSPEGELKESRICRGIRYGYDMCPATDFAKDTMTAEVEALVGAGVDYIQALDQNHGGLSTFCYSKEHGHPPVPGSWQIKEMKDIINKMAGKKEKLLIGCESAAAETFIPGLLFNDNRFNINYMVGKPVPLYAYLYHEYVNNFMGNQVCTHVVFNHDKEPENLFYRMAYAFVAGDMPTVVTDENGNPTYSWIDTESKTRPSPENVFRFIKNTNAWRCKTGKKYLHTGRMVKPHEITTDKITFHLKNGQSITYGKILTSSFTAEDNTAGHIFVNYMDTPEKCCFEKKKGCKYYIFNTPDTEPREALGNNIELEIPPYSAMLAVSFDAEEIQ